MKRFGVLLPVLIGLVFFGPLALSPTSMLYSDHSDMIAEHVPAKEFWARSWRETGEWPLWCPLAFGGSPFVHDPQVGMFYPPYWLVLLAPAGGVGAALSWIVVGHVLLAGVGMYLYAKHRHMDSLGAVVAACGLMFAGRWLAHLLVGGHTIVVGLAWMPLVMLFMERGIRGNFLLNASVAGLLFGLVVLGTQPQWTLYAGVFAALWTWGEVAVDLPRWRGLAPGWLGCGLITASLGGAIAAVQLLPTFEAAAHSTRAGGVPDSDAIGGGVRALLFLFGPPVVGDPALARWEDRGAFGVITVLAVLMAIRVTRGRARYEAGVLLGLLVFSFGGSILFQFLPVFQLFRQPSRMIIVAGIPVAYFLGLSVQYVFSEAGRDETRAKQERGWFWRVLIVALILVGGFAARSRLAGQVLLPHAYWLSLLCTLPVAYLLLGPRAAGPNRRTQWTWAGLVLVDLWALSWSHVEVRDEQQIYKPSACVQPLLGDALPWGRVLDQAPGPNPTHTPLGVGAVLAVRDGIPAVRGYNPIDVLRYKEYLQMVGGEEPGLKVLDHVLAYPVLGNFPITESRLLDLLGVRYFLWPSEMPPDPGWKRVVRDDQPVAFDMVKGGMQSMAPFSLYENPHAFLRAYVAHRVETKHPGETWLEAMRRVDFTEAVLLEGEETRLPVPVEDLAGRQVEIVRSEPNRQAARVSAGSPGILVFNDVWYPGWKARVDGEDVPLLRANYLYRAVRIGKDACLVEMSFEPASLERGRKITMVALGIALAMMVGGLLTGRYRQAR